MSFKSLRIAIAFWILTMAGCRPSLAQTFNAHYDFSDYASSPQGIRQIIIEPLIPVSTNNGRIVVASPITRILDTGGGATVSNLAINNPYKVTFTNTGTRFSTSFTNVFPTNLSGTVNAKDYIGGYTNGVFQYQYLPANITTNGGSVPANVLTNGQSGVGIGLVNLIPTNATYNTQDGLGQTAYQLPFNLTNGVVYYFVADEAGHQLENQDANLTFPSTGITAIFTNSSAISQPMFVIDGVGDMTPTSPVNCKLFVLSQNFSTNSFAGNSVGVHTGTFNGDASGLTNLISIAQAADDIRYQSIAQGFGCGSMLLPNLLFGTSPTVIELTGDSMSDAGFNATDYYLMAMLRDEFGNCGFYNGGLDASYGGTQAARLTTTGTSIYRRFLTMANGAIVYASDGTNAVRGIESPATLPVNYLGYWWYANPLGGNIAANFTNSAGTLRVTLNGYSATEVLLHTNFQIPIGTNGVAYFTSLVGTNYILGFDQIVTNQPGIVEFDWYRGGVELYNILVSNLSAQSFTNMLKAVKPQIILVESRNNGQESVNGITNEANQLALIASGFNPQVNVVTICPPLVDNSPNANAAWIAMGQTGSPFFNIRLDKAFQNYAALTAWGMGFNPHPTALGGKMSAVEVYRQLGFNRPFSTAHVFNSTDTTTVPSQGYSGTPATIGQLGAYSNAISPNMSLTTTTNSSVSNLLVWNGTFWTNASFYVSTDPNTNGRILCYIEQPGIAPEITSANFTVIDAVTLHTNGLSTNNAINLTNLQATKLVGTVADANLSANVPLKNGANVFTGTSNSFTTIGAKYIYPMGSGSSPTITTNFGAFQAPLFLEGNDDRFHFMLPLAASGPAANTKLFTVNFGAAAPIAPYDVQFSAASIAGTSLPAVAGVNICIRLYASNFTTTTFDVWCGSTALTVNTTNVIFCKICR